MTTPDAPTTATGFERCIRWNIYGTVAAEEEDGIFDIETLQAPKGTLLKKEPGRCRSRTERFAKADRGITEAEVTTNVYRLILG